MRALCFRCSTHDGQWGIFVHLIFNWRPVGHHLPSRNHLHQPVLRLFQPFQLITMFLCFFQYTLESSCQGDKGGKGGNMGGGRAKLRSPVPKAPWGGRSKRVEEREGKSETERPSPATQTGNLPSHREHAPSSICCSRESSGGCPR